TNCADTVCCEASAILSLPLLAHPPRSADESPTATKIRHAITPPTGLGKLLLIALARYPSTIYYPCEGFRADQYPYVEPTNDRQRQCGTPADDSEQQLPRILRS